MEIEKKPKARCLDGIDLISNNIYANKGEFGNIFAWVWRWIDTTNSESIAFNNKFASVVKPDESFQSEIVSNAVKTNSNSSTKP
jgi:hypothetical protein